MAVIEPTSPIICDAGPLIHLDELDCLDLLSDFGSVLVPEAVWEEVRRHRAHALDGTLCRVEQVAVRAPVDPGLHAVFKVFSLDSGEQEALLLMTTRPGAVLLTDDAAARLAARSLGFRSHGRIGILLRAIRREQRTRDQVLAILRGLPSRSTLHIRLGLLQEIIQEVERGE